MSLIKYCVILFLVVPFVMDAMPIASVEDHEITYEQLSEEMAILEESTDMTYVQLRERALQNLIEDKVLIVYAEHNNIAVDDIELDSFFMNHLGDHPRFLTNGFFDRKKYSEFKTTGTGKKILQEMGQEILVNKVKTGINSSFDLTDDVLYKEFVLDNAEIDISYAIVDVNLANVTVKHSPSKAIEYYHKNRKEFKTEEKLKLEMILVPYSDFREPAETYFNFMNDDGFQEDNTLTAIQADSLRTDVINTKMKELAAKEAERIKFKLELNQPIEYQIMETSFLSRNDRTGSIPLELLDNAFSMKENRFSDPYELDVGFLIYRISAHQKPRIQEIDEIPQTVWLSYIQNVKEEQHSDEFREYFIEHIDEFIIPVAVVELVVIPEFGFFNTFRTEDEQTEFINSLKRHKNNERDFDRILTNYNIDSEINVIFLEKFKNKTTVNEIIATSINNSKESGVFKNESISYFYNVKTHFPEYIPNYRDISDQINRVELTTETDTTTFQEFFHNYNKDFVTPDSLQLGGLFFPIVTDSIEIDSSEIFSYYNENINNFYRGKAVKYEYVFVKDEASAHMIRDYAVNGIDFDLLKFCFNTTDPLPSDDMILLNDLPPEIVRILSETRDNSISFPTQFGNGWIVFYKTDSRNEGLRDIYDVFDEIEHKFQYEIADSIAQIHAQTVFDSTRYYSQCFKFKELGELFKTIYQRTDLKFEHLGFLGEYKQDLLRLWKNEKYSSVIKADSGYAVVYQLQKRSSRQLEYEQALPKIKEIFYAKTKLKNSKEYLNSLRNKIIDGQDPDSLFFFLGGWRTEESLDLNSDIFGSEYSSLILYDIVGKSEGYFSPVLSLAENTLFFYRINRLSKISRTDFEQQKDEFRIKVQSERFDNWIKMFKAKLNIFINI